MPRRSLLGSAVPPTTSLFVQKCLLTAVETVVGRRPHTNPAIQGFSPYMEFDLEETVLPFPTQCSEPAVYRSSTESETPPRLPAVIGAGF